jgi:hypothetical protein
MRSQPLIQESTNQVKLDKMECRNGRCNMQVHNRKAERRNTYLLPRSVGVEQRDGTQKPPSDTFKIPQSISELYNLDVCSFLARYFIFMGGTGPQKSL